MTGVQIIRIEGPKVNVEGPARIPPLAIVTAACAGTPISAARHRGRLAIVNRTERGTISRRGDRQPEEYPRSPAGHRFEVDHASVVPDDPVAHRETQPSPHPDRLGGEERLEDLRPELGVDADTIVGDFDLDGIINFPRAYDTPPASGACIDRVHDQVLHDHVDLGGE